MKIWYTIEKSSNGYTVWRNKVGKQSMGSNRIYTSKNKKDCIEYCKENNIKIKKR